MRGKERLDGSDVRALLKLANGLHVAPDPLIRKRRMIEGLCELTEARCGMVFVTNTDAAKGKSEIVSSVEYRPEGDALSQVPPAVVPVGMNQKIADPCDPSVLQSGSAQSQVLHFQWPEGARPPRLTGRLISSRPLPADKAVGTICLFRPPGRVRPFTMRHQLLVDLFHEEASWVYQPDVLLLSASARSLSPRERQTLELLLAGFSEKQIANQLRLSPNTVHHYVKSLHRHFDVSSRGELLARWAAK